MIKSIKLYTLGTSFEILEYIDPVSVSHLEHLSPDIFDSGTFNIDLIKKDEFLGIDMARPIPTDSLIEITLENNEVIQGLISEDVVSPVILGGNLYRHKVRFVDPLKLLTKINLPSLSITQPKTPGYLISDNLIAEANNSIANEKVFEGNHDGELRFLSPVHPLTESGGKSYTEYNILHKDNTFLEESDSGVRLDHGVEREIILTDNIILSGENKTSIKIEADIFNPQYDWSINYKNEEYLYGNVENNTVTFRDASTNLEITVYIDGVEYFKDVVNIREAKVANGYWYKRREKTFTGIQYWFNEHKENLKPSDYSYILASGSWTSITNVKDRYNIIVQNTERKKDPTEVDRIIPHNKQKKYSVALYDYITTIYRTIQIPQGVSGDVAVKMRILNEKPWKLSGSMIYKHGVFAANQTTTKHSDRNMNKRLLVKKLNVSVYESAKDAKYLDDQVEKALNTVSGHIIKLDEDSKARLSFFKAPELTYDKNNLFEIVKDLGLYIGATPKLKIRKDSLRTKWTLCSEVDYNESENKLFLYSDEEGIIEILNNEYQNYPLGYAVKVQPQYEFEQVSFSDYNSAEYTVDIAMTIGGTILPADIWYGLKIFHPNYYNNRELMYEREVVIYVDDIGLGSQCFKLVLSDSAIYAKTEEVSGRIIDEKILKYTFYEDVDKSRVMELENSQIESIYRDSDNYTSSIELNVENLVSEDEVVDTDWLQIHSLDESNRKITTDNIGVKLPHGPIYKMIEAKIMTGREILMEGRELKIESNEEIDITDLIVEESYFNTRINKSNYTTNERIGEATMNQTLYYKQGEPYIYNMAFTGTHKPSSQWEDKPESNRAIWELIAKKAVEKFGINTNKTVIDTGKVSDDLNIRIRFKYVPYKSTRTYVYKDDQSGFPELTTRFYNEQQRVNNPAALGRKAQSEINRMGNTHQELDGYTADLNRVPELATLNKVGGRALVSRNRAFSPHKVSYVGTYVKDYSIINEYFGIESAYRQWEVPKEDIVERVDRREAKYYFTTNPSENPPLHNPFGDVRDAVRAFGASNQNYKTEPTHAVIETFDIDKVRLVKVIRPVNTQAIGKGLTHTYKMANNFSAGKRAVREMSDGEYLYYQQDVEYADFYGYVETVKVTFVRIDPDGIVDPYTNQNRLEYMRSQNPEYPIITNDNMWYADVISEYNYRVQKDARETMGFAQDIKFFSGEPEKIKIYEGLAKYNTMSSLPQDIINIKVGILKEPLSRSAVKIDPDQLVENDNNTKQLYFDNELVFTVYGDGVEVVYYHADTLEPLLVYKPDNEIIGSLTDTIYIELREK